MSRPLGNLLFERWTKYQKLKETLGKNKLELSKLLEELNSLFLFLAGDLGLSMAYDRSSSDQKISTPLS